MADKTAIEWTDATWNPLRGCTRVSEGCRNCYAEHVAARFSGPGQAYEGLAERTAKGPRWTGKVALIEKALDQPLRWRKPRMIFVNSMSDLFHESVPDAWIDRVFAVMALAPQHTFQVLTKRPERMRAYVESRAAMIPVDGFGDFLVSPLAVAAKRVSHAAGHPVWQNAPLSLLPWPLPNVWLGTSVEDQPTADARIPHLLATPAAVRFVSAEPLLGAVDLTRVTYEAAFAYEDVRNVLAPPRSSAPRLDWIIVGGESGPGARPMHPDWARSLRDQCAAAGVAFFFKQWGAWGPPKKHPVPAQTGALIRHTVAASTDPKRVGATTWCAGRGPGASSEIMDRAGKTRAGRLLDGRTHDAMPGARP